MEVEDDRRVLATRRVTPSNASVPAAPAEPLRPVTPVDRQDGACRSPPGPPRGAPRRRGPLVFSNACRLARRFTRPVVIARRYYDGTVECGIGAFIVVNAD